MQAQQKLFVIVLTAVAIIFIGLMAMIYASLIPHFQEIGDWAVWVVRIAMGCGTALMVAFTWFKIQEMRHNSKFVQRGEVVTYIGPGKPYVVSADHERAKVPHMLPAPEEKKVTIDDETIIELRKGGMTLMDIVEWGKPAELKYNRVQAVVAAAKQRGELLS